MKYISAKCDKHSAMPRNSSIRTDQPLFAYDGQFNECSSLLLFGQQIGVLMSQLV